jgi:radical SAM protein with 4Fe4S-binding SPASM domain
LDRITLSAEGCTAELYEKKRVGARFDVVVANIEALQALKNKMGVSHPKIRVQTVMLPEIKPILEEYKRFWGNRADEIAFLDFKEMAHKKRGVVYPWACPQLWQRMAVWWDGTVLPCNHDDDGLLALGNAKHDFVKVMWNSPAMKQLRDGHRNGMAHTFAACNGCYLRDSEIEKIKQRI